MAQTQALPVVSATVLWTLCGLQILKLTEISEGSDRFVTWVNVTLVTMCSITEQQPPTMTRMRRRNASD